MLLKKFAEHYSSIVTTLSYVTYILGGNRWMESIPCFPVQFYYLPAFQEKQMDWSVVDKPWAGLGFQGCVLNVRVSHTQAYPIA
uniref:Uncharacterized protein n=1 Tax=Romanomermis culicivorax TaxID=13658 RepID=A0A915J924_ROMCU